MKEQIESLVAKLTKIAETAAAQKETAEGIPEETKEAFKNLDLLVRNNRTVFGVTGYQRKEREPAPDGFITMEEFAELLGVKLVTLRARWPLYRVEEHRFDGHRGLFFKKDEAEVAAKLNEEKKIAKAEAKEAREAAKEAAKAAKEAAKAEAAAATATADAEETDRA